MRHYRPGLTERTLSPLLLESLIRDPLWIVARLINGENGGAILTLHALF